MDTLNILYFVGALLIFASIMASTLSARLGMPLLLIFLAVGMLAGEQGILGIEFEAYGLANFIGQAALACILLDGGLRTSIRSFRVGLKPAVTLATWGVLATVLSLGVFISWLLGVDWRLGMLMAAIVGSTDAAAVFSLLRNGGVKLNDRVQATLEIESGANDPLAILLVTGLIALNLDPSSQTPVDFLILLVEQIGIGMVLGLLAGHLLSKLLPKVHLAEGMYAILIMSAGLAVFAATNILGGSGFLAIYLAGVIIGNRRVRATEHVLRVMDSFAWLSQAVLFVVLGLLVTPSHIIEQWHYALAIALFLVFIARPLAVFSGLTPFHFKSREMGFISWVGLRGAVPITLAIIPVMSGVPHSQQVFDITFGVVILSLLLQGTTIPFMAQLFKVRMPTNHEPKEQHEIWVGDHASITLYEFEVKSGAFAIGRHPQAISSRVNAKEVSVFAFVRDEKLVPVTESTALITGDVVWYALRGDHANAIAQIFNDTTFQRQEVNDFYGDWLISPHVRIADLPFFNEQARLQAGIKKNLPRFGVESQTIGNVLPSDLPELEHALDGELKAMLKNEIKNQTVGEFVSMRLETEPVAGDRIHLNDEWALVVKEVDKAGHLRSIGLRQHKKNEDKKTDV